MDMTTQAPLYERFTFHSRALPKDHDCKVVRFKGTEGIGKLYNFEIQLISRENLNTSSILATPCMFRIERKDAAPAFFHGYLTSISQEQEINGWTFYTLRLEPQFAKLKNIVQNCIYVDKSVQDILEVAFGNCGVLKPEHTFMLHGDYPTHEFSMQYNENVYEYMLFLIEREGYYYYFEQKEEQEHIIFTDSPMNHTFMEEAKSLRYYPTSGLEVGHTEEVIVAFTRNQTPLPKEIFVRDFNWKKPNLTIEATALVDEDGLGTLFFYSDGFGTAAEGKRLAKVRADSLRCRGTTFHGVSSVPTMRPGYIFSLKDHYDENWNTNYFTTDVVHEGSQEGYLSSVLGIDLQQSANTFYYRNTFMCISDKVPFRLERKTERRKIPGVIHAFIDASSDSPTPEIDSFGRYKVIFPQDTSGRSSGKASCWIRRAQPSVGVGYGTSFPLAPGVEVLIAFMDGNPDRPFISGALSNPETGFTDHADRALFSGISTAGGGGLIFNDKAEKQGFNLTTGSGRSGMFMSSGSLDTAAIYSNNVTQVATTSTSNFATFFSSLESGFDASLMANGNISKRKLILGALQALTTLADTAAKETDATPAATHKLNAESAKAAETTARATYLSAVDAHKKNNTTQTADNQENARRKYLEAQKKSATAQNTYEDAQKWENSSNISPHTGWEIAATILKALELAQTTYVDYKKIMGTASTNYGATINATDEKNLVQLKVKFTEERQKQTLKWLTASLLFKGVAYGAEAAASEVEAKKLDEEFESTRKNMAVEKRFQELRADSNKTHTSSEDLYTQAQKDIDSANDKTLASYYAKVDEDAYIKDLKKELEQAKAAKRAARARTGISGVGSLVPEIAAMIARRKVADMNKNTFGGIRLKSATNIASTSEHSYLSAEKGISFVSLPSAGNYAELTPPETLNTIHDNFLNIDPTKTFIAAETEQLRAVGLQDVTVFGTENITLKSAKNISLSNKFHNEQNDREPLLPTLTTLGNATAEGLALAQAQANLTTLIDAAEGVATQAQQNRIGDAQEQVNQAQTAFNNMATLLMQTKALPLSPAYAHITLDNDANKQSLTLENVGKSLTLTQIAVDDTKQSQIELTHYKQDGNTKLNSLLLNKSISTLTYNEDGTANKNRSLNLSQDSTSLKHGKNSALTLQDTLLRLSLHQDNKNILGAFVADNYGVKLWSETKDADMAGRTIHLEAKKDISINAEKNVTLIGGDSKLTITTGSYTTTAKIIKLN